MATEFEYLLKRIAKKTISNRIEGCGFKAERGKLKLLVIFKNRINFRRIRRFARAMGIEFVGIREGQIYVFLEFLVKDMNVLKERAFAYAKTHQLL